MWQIWTDMYNEDTAFTDTFIVPGSLDAVTR